MAEKLNSELPIVVVRLRPSTTAFIDYMVDLANIDISNEGQVKDAIGPFARIEQWIELSPNPKGDQRLLRRRLNQMMEGKTAGLALRLSGDLGVIQAEGGLAVEKETNEIAWMLSPKLTSLRHGIAYILASLLQDDLADRIHRCALKDCGKYFVDWPGERGKAGWDARYCSKRHNDRDRSRRYRARKKAEAQK